LISISLLKEEIIRHKNKILKISKIDESIFQLVLSKIRFIDDILLSNQELEKAQTLVKHIDANDALFVALSQKLNAHLWTGDKVLFAGLQSQGFEKVITTEQMLEVYLSKL